MASAGALLCPHVDGFSMHCNHCDSLFLLGNNLQLSPRAARIWAAAGGAGAFQARTSAAQNTRPRSGTASRVATMPRGQDRQSEEFL